MSKIRRTRLFSIILMVAFLAASTLTRATTVDDAIDLPSNEEKQVEDKSETNDKDDKTTSFISNLIFICEVSLPVPTGNDDFDNTYARSLLTAVHPIPLFLQNEAFLI